MNSFDDSSIYSFRKTIDHHVLDLPFDINDANVHLINVATLRVFFSAKSRPFDLGSLVYSDRKPAPKSARGVNKDRLPNSLYAVNTDSYEVSRKEPIERYLEHLFIEARKGISNDTLENSATNTIKFMFWCDSMGYQQCLNDVSHAREAFSAYVSMLEHKLKTHDSVKKIGLSRATVTAYQNMTKRFLAIALDIHQNILVEGIRQLRTRRNERNLTHAPDHSTIGQNLALWWCLFKNITDFLLNEKQYPFELLLPAETVWVFPSDSPFLTKKTINIRNNKFTAFDRELGNILGQDELKGGASNRKSSADRAQQQLISANSNLRHSERIRLGNIAHNAFFMMFMLYTRTRAEIRHIQWSDGSVIENSDSVGFKIIKARAKGKICEYRVASKFTRELKNFLKLREWLLNDQPFEYLFLKINTTNGKATKASANTSTYFSKSVVLQLISPDFPTITPSESRVAGADHFVNTYDIPTAATMLQNEQSTFKQSYSNGNHQRASQQLTEFFSRLNDRIYDSSSDTSSHVSIPSGSCAQFEVPKPEPSTPIEVNCHTPQGCLFCEKFAVHADETDIRKLLSLEYIIKESKILANSIEHFESTFGESLVRISSLLSKLSQLNKRTESLTNTIRKEVYEDEKLSLYWDSKLSQLVNMGIL
jgi:hypothetical protein